MPRPESTRVSSSMKDWERRLGPSSVSQDLLSHKGPGSLQHARPVVTGSHGMAAHGGWTAGLSLLRQRGWPAWAEGEPDPSLSCHSAEIWGKGVQEGGLLDFNSSLLFKKKKLWIEATINPSPSRDASEKGHLPNFNPFENLSQRDKSVDKNEFFIAYGRCLSNAWPHLSKVH